MTVVYDEKQEADNGIVLNIQPLAKKEPKPGAAEPEEKAPAG